MQRSRKDLIKTAGAILVIVAIIAAAFLYGNKQHQNQVRNQQEQTASTDQSTSSDQSQSTSSQSTDQSTSDQSQSQSSAPQTGGTDTTTPQTGPELYFLFPAAAMVGLGRTYLKSRRAIRTAALK